LVQAQYNTPWYYSILKPFIAPVTICGSDPTVPANYYTSTVSLINTFQANATYNAVLQLIVPNFVAYFKNPTNLALLNSNCTAFVIGVKQAQAADQTVRQARQQISQDISRRIGQIPHIVTNSNAPNVLDFNNKKGNHHH
jgi:hypothetical protein